MKIKIALFCIALLVSAQVFPCVVSPAARVASNISSTKEKSDLAILGKLIEFVDLKYHEQIVTLEVIELYKGPAVSTVTVHNDLSSSCSQVFVEKGSLYYVFASHDGSRYIAHGTFISEKRATELDLDIDIKP